MDKLTVEVSTEEVVAAMKKADLDTSGHRATLDECLTAEVRAIRAAGFKIVKEVRAEHANKESDNG